MDSISKSWDDLINHNILFKDVLPYLFNQRVNLSLPDIPIISELLPYIGILIQISLVALVIYLVRLILSLRKTLKEESVTLELTPPAFSEKTAYTTQELFKIFHNAGKQRSFIDKLLGKKTTFSFEIVSTQYQGIRHLVRTTPNQINNIKRNLLSYMPQVRVKTVDEYLPKNLEKQEKYHTKIVEFKLSNRFAFPLKKQDTLSEHDPVAYITGGMTKLLPNELISLQVILSPTQPKEVQKLSRMITSNENASEYLRKLQFSWYIQIPLEILKLGGNLVYSILSALLETFSEMRHGAPKKYYAAYPPDPQRPKSIRMLTSVEQQENRTIQGKIEQLLFETTIRLLIVSEDKQEQRERINNFISSVATFSEPGYQALIPKRIVPSRLQAKIRTYSFKKRLLSLVRNSSSTILSVSEVADLYHFPFARVNQTENIIKAYSKELPAPVSLKNGRKLDVVFGKNTYGGTTTDIGLSEEERETHMYIIGRTGSGKTTMMFSMAKHDIESGRGMAFLDPHGDVADDLVSIIPEHRLNDLIFINPIDLKYPIGINLLELTPGLDEDAAELEKEVVTEGVISLFRKVFSKEENTNAHRIEYILRNAIYTSFYIEDRTIFTIYDLLNNPPFQKQVIAKLKDENLKNFWKFEFGRAGDYQIVKMVGGVTAKIGRFLFSPTAKRILEQKRSTINFDEILDSGKILICNLSQGKLGEDTSRLLGTTIMTKIQQAALKRANMPENKRTPFYLYVDEFQNFASQSFTKMMSEGRKYKLRVTIAEQSTSQQQDRNIVNVILANVTTVVCFRSANPIDEDLMLAQFAPYVQKGDISNLSKYHFYIKVSALDPEEPYSGETIYIPLQKDVAKVEKLIEASRRNWAIVYEKPKVEATKIIVEKSTPQPPSTSEKTLGSNGLPKKNKPQNSTYA